MEMWKDKENFIEVVESEMKNLEKYIDGNEKEALKQIAFNRNNSVEMIE